MKFNIRLLYLYLFSFIGLVIIILGSVRLVDLGLKVFIFTGADEYVMYPRSASLDIDGKRLVEPSEEEEKEYQQLETKRQRQSTVAEALAMIVVGVPLYAYHWGIIKKQK